MAEFEITMNGEIVGKAIAERQGLYYRFRCQCTFPDNEIHAVWVCWDSGNRKLGVCVPDGKQFCLSTKVPAKYIPDDGLTFTIDHKEQNNFYPVDEEKPFALVDQLTQAYFDIREGRPGLVIPE